jgi:hypothetical protein
MELFRLAARPPDWDQRIRRFPNKSFGHESAWHDYVYSVSPGTTIEYFEIRDAGRTVGYFCMARMKKLLYSLYRSPMSGPGRHLGPVVEPHVNQDDFVRCLIELCRSSRIAHLEISNDWLDESVMRRTGFRATADVVHVCPLDGGNSGVWARMWGACRTRIRKAERNGLRAEVTDDPGIVDVFYSQFTGVLKRKRLPVPYSLAAARSLFRHLIPADMLFAIQVKFEGRVGAAGLYPHDERALYHLDSGYDPNYLHLAANGLLHWTAIKLAIARGIPLFRMSSGRSSRFTQQFGGAEAPYVVYRQSLVPFAESARAAYLVGRNIASKAKAVSTSWARLRETGAAPGPLSALPEADSASDSSPGRARWLIVVQPHQGELYQLLRHQVGVTAPVIMDRRQGCLDGHAVAPDSHPGDRRTNSRPLTTIYSLEPAGEEH